jgi:hypothetical protein
MTNPFCLTRAPIVYTMNVVVPVRHERCEMCDMMYICEHVRLQGEGRSLKASNLFHYSPHFTRIRN